MDKAASAALIKEVAALVKTAQANPFHYFNFGDTAKLFGFGVNTLTAIVNAGAPVVSRKINPTHLSAWLATNSGLIPKIREE